MHSTIINGIEVEYSFYEGRPATRYDEQESPSIVIKSLTIEHEDAYAFVQSCTDEDSAYEFSDTLDKIEELTLDYHLSNRI